MVSGRGCCLLAADWTRQGKWPGPRVTSGSVGTVQGAAPVHGLGSHLEGSMEITGQ